eukprot:scaffold7551_cov123-Isochrysis_galbana.AAC.9
MMQPLAPRSLARVDELTSKPARPVGTGGLLYALPSTAVGPARCCKSSCPLRRSTPLQATSYAIIRIRPPPRARAHSHSFTRALARVREPSNSTPPHRHDTATDATLPPFWRKPRVNDRPRGPGPTSYMGIPIWLARPREACCPHKVQRGEYFAGPRQSSARLSACALTLTANKSSKLKKKPVGCHAATPPRSRCPPPAARPPAYYLLLCTTSYFLSEISLFSDSAMPSPADARARVASHHLTPAHWAGTLDF